MSQSEGTVSAQSKQEVFNNKSPVYLSIEHQGEIETQGEQIVALEQTTLPFLPHISNSLIIMNKTRITIHN